MKTLVLIPTYNESGNIRVLLREIWKHSENLNVLIVDDHSSDKTALVVKSIQKDHGDKLHLLEREAKLGLTSAYQEGFLWAIRNKFDSPPQVS